MFGVLFQIQFVINFINMLQRKASLPKLSATDMKIEGNKQKKESNQDLPNIEKWYINNRKYIRLVPYKP